MISRVIVLAFTMLPWSLLAQTAQKPLPRFQDYPPTEKWSGVHSDVQITSAEERLFRTNLREASKQPPNFAGRYRVTSWGCGTVCIQGGMVDLETGSVSPLPPGGKKRGEGYWDVCYSAFGLSGHWELAIGYRADSRLLVLRCADATGRDGGAHIRTSYYIYENGSFEKIRSVVSRERVF